MTLGILDWGIGGVGFYRAFKARFPEVPVVYLSDAGCEPYGKMTARELEARLSVAGAALRRAGVTRLVVACNAMSTVLPRWSCEAVGLREACGVIDSAVEAVLEADVAVVGVVGGVRTIRSGAYRRPLCARGMTVRQRIAQPLSALIEAGLTASPAFLAETRRVMAPLARVDALVLACTHYWAGVARFRELTGAAIVVDPAHETLERVVARWFGIRESRAGRGPESGDRFFVTGDPAAMARAATLAFGVTLPPVVGVGADLVDLAAERVASRRREADGTADAATPAGRPVRHASAGG